MILIVSHPADDHAVRVLGLLRAAGHPTVLLDTAKYPRHTAVRLHFDGPPRYEVTVGDETLDLTGCRAAWWRRPQPYVLHDGLAPQAAAFTLTECHEALAGLWAALPATWVNRPELDEVAHHKPYQLAIASAVGLPVPRTLITNDPVAARGFVDALSPERTVYKTFIASEQHWRETRVMKPDELALLDTVRLAPVIFQEYVPATADIRATVIGHDIFAAEVLAAPGGYAVDYRVDLDGATVRPTTLPPATTEAIRRLMDRLGLLYGAIDLRRTPSGEHVFLEINPAGEWLFVEDRTEQPISDALAQLLIRYDRGDA